MEIFLYKKAGRLSIEIDDFLVDFRGANEYTVQQYDAIANTKGVHSNEIQDCDVEILSCPRMGALESDFYDQYKGIFDAAEGRCAKALLIRMDHPLNVVEPEVRALMSAILLKVPVLRTLRRTTIVLHDNDISERFESTLVETVNHLGRKGVVQL